MPRRRNAKDEAKLQKLRNRGLDVDGMVARLLADPAGESGKVYKEIRDHAHNAHNKGKVRVKCTHPGCES